MDADSHYYYRRRAEQEAAAAQLASTPKAAQIHAELADHYDQLARLSEPTSGPVARQPRRNRADPPMRLAG